MSSTRFLKKLQGFLNNRGIGTARVGQRQSDGIPLVAIDEILDESAIYEEQRHQIYHEDLMMTCHRTRHEGEVIIPTKGSHCL